MSGGGGAAATPRITVLIADDEQPARRGLRALLEAHDDIEVVGEARSGSEAVAAIEGRRPDLVFLDVQMPDGDGFEVVRQVGAARMPVVVFATAHDEYALRAFDASALDYLLKPYDRERFDIALERARQRLRRATADDRLRVVLEQLDARARGLQRIAVRQGARTVLVPVASVDYLEAETNYVRVHAGDRSWLVRDTLAGMAAQLDPARFLRVHRSLVVQLARIVEVESLFAGEYVLFLANGRKLTTGRTYRAAVQAALRL